MDIASVLSDPSTSDWLKCALSSATIRDPVDAATDAALLLELLEQRLSNLFVAHGIELAVRTTD